MKKLFVAALALIGFCIYAQDYKFDYQLEYTDTDGNPFSYYINSKDKGYILKDGDYHMIVNNEFMIYFSVSLSGKTRIFDIIADEVDNNPTKVETVSEDKNVVTINGFKCRKYTYSTMITDTEDPEKTAQVTYVAYITDNGVNTADVLDRNEALFPDSIVSGKFPAGTLVQFESISNDLYDGFIHMKLTKVTKLEKPLVLDITNAQVTKFLINNQAK